MSVTTDTLAIKEITRQALGLSAKERALLLDRLHESLLSNREREIEDAWLKVAVRRLEEVRSGAVEPIDSEDVFDETRRALRK
ncbi:MAG TPA: addiction module protein [Pyrinomonadaceae bacterium]|nr:addiction module protein [Pyrinomonadaceae bacterium]